MKTKAESSHKRSNKSNEPDLNKNDKNVKPVMKYTDNRAESVKQGNLKKYNR